MQPMRSGGIQRKEEGRSEERKEGKEMGECVK